MSDDEEFLELANASLHDEVNRLRLGHVAALVVGRRRENHVKADLEAAQRVIAGVTSERDEVIREREALTAERAALRLHAEALEREIEAMKTSSSWRVSKPLRWTADRVRRLR